MRPASFRYHRPDRLDEVLDLLAELPDARLIAGGQSLVPAMMLRLAQYEALIDIGRVPGLDQIAIDSAKITIGARVTHATIEHSCELKDALPALPEAARSIAHPAIRTRGTFGGSLAHADSAAEWPTVALALGGNVHAQSRRGRRTLPVDRFFVGALSTQLEADEVLVAAEFDRLKPREHLLFAEFARQSGAFAIAIVTIRVEVSLQGRLAGLRVAVGGCGDTPKQPVTRWDDLLDADLTPVTIEEIGARVVAALDPQSDLNATSEDRRSVVQSLIGRTMTTFCENQQQGRGS